MQRLCRTFGSLVNNIVAVDFSQSFTAYMKIEKKILLITGPDVLHRQDVLCDCT